MQVRAIADAANDQAAQGRDPGAPLPVRASDGILLGARLFANPAAKARLVVSHGNGLASFGYRVFWENLRKDFELVVVDVRGHGMSEPGAAGHHHWPQFVADLETLRDTLAQQLDPRPTFGAFHSLSAVASLLQSHHHGRRWDGLVLFDPPLAPPAGHPLRRAHERDVEMLVEGALRRRPSFAHPAELAGRFARPEIFGAWEDPAPMDMACATLRPDSDSQEWVLACAPDREAFVFRTNMDERAWEAMLAPPCPIHIIASDPHAPQPGAPALTSLAAHQEAGVSYDAIAGTGHFLQLEQPGQCRAALRRFIASCGQAAMMNPVQTT